MNQMSRIPATPAKLRYGSWGARVSDADVREGDVITITTRSGKSWDARVTRIVWSNDSVAVCATESLDRPASPTRRGRGTWTGCSCGSVSEFTKDSDCWTCKHDADDAY